MTQSTTAPTRYIHWRKGDELADTPVSADETVLNPDPDGTRRRMLEAGWSPMGVDPVPGIIMKPWRPNHRSYTSIFD